jgi:hypothetical protein
MDNLMEQIQSYVNTFSEPLDEDESDMNIDIQKIEEKINKIKSRRKYTENYSGIETLDNIYEEPIESLHEDLDDDDIIENFQEGAKNRGKVKTKGKPKKSTIGRLTDYINKVSGTAVKYLDNAKSGFFYLHKELDKQLTKFAGGFVVTISRATNPKMIDLEYDLSNANDKQKKNINTDTNAVKQHIYSFFSLLVGLYATYNWFYLMVYMREKEGTDGEMERPFGDDNRMKISLDGIKDKNIKTSLDFIFNYTITPLFWFDKIFNDNLYSSFANNVVQWKILNYFIIFVLVLFLNIKLGLFDSLNKILTLKLPYLFWACTIIILCKFLYNIIEFSKSNFNIPTPLSSILVIFIYIILTTLIATGSINISSILVVLFLWIHSLFGIALYNKDGIKGVLNEITNINSYIKRDYDDLTDEYCDSLDWFSQWLMIIVKFLNDNRSIVCVAIVLIINLFTIKFHSLYVKLFIHLPFILLFGSYFLLQVEMLIENPKAKI